MIELATSTGQKSTTLTCGRQLRFRQAIPVLFFDSLQYGTSYLLCSPLEVTFQATWCSLEVMSRITHKFVALKFECTPSFATWWEASGQKSMMGILGRPTIVSLGRYSSSFFPKKKEFSSWKEAINQKNQLLLIGMSLIYVPVSLYEAFAICGCLTFFLICSPICSPRQY